MASYYDFHSRLTQEVADLEAAGRRRRLLSSLTHALPSERGEDNYDDELLAVRRGELGLLEDLWNYTTKV